MPSTPAQMRAAGRELRLRREGKVKQEPVKGRGKRPFGAASTETLRSYASWPDPSEQRRAAQREFELRKSRLVLYETDANRAFGKATEEELMFFMTASEEEIRRRNGEI